jgi:DNA-binding MarR family transcriptional regulator
VKPATKILLASDGLPGSRESPEDRRTIAVRLNDAGTHLVKKVNRQPSHRDRDLPATAFDRFATCPRAIRAALHDSPKH